METRFIVAVGKVEKDGYTVKSQEHLPPGQQVFIVTELDAEAVYHLAKILVNFKWQRAPVRRGLLFFSVPAAPLARARHLLKYAAFNRCCKVTESMFEKSSFMRGKKQSISPLPRPTT